MALARYTSPPPLPPSVLHLCVRRRNAGTQAGGGTLTHGGDNVSTGEWLRLGVGESWRGVVALAVPVLLYNFSKLNLDHTLCGASPSLSRVAEYAQFALKLCMRVLPCPGPSAPWNLHRWMALALDASHSVHWQWHCQCTE